MVLLFSICGILVSDVVRVVVIPTIIIDIDQRCDLHVIIVIIMKKKPPRVGTNIEHTHDYCCEFNMNGLVDTI